MLGRNVDHGCKERDGVVGMGFAQGRVSVHCGLGLRRCVEGRLLLLAPTAWPYTPGKKQMTRDDACVLNRIAQAIARDGAADIDYKGRTPVDVDGMTRRAVAVRT